jgi:hypothetical protein
VFARTALISVAFAVFLCLAQFAAARPAASTHQSHGVLRGSVSQVNRTWVCRGPVNLSLVRVTMTSAIRTRRHADAVHLKRGCTGRIGRLEVVTSAGDAVKVAEGAHDLAIGGGAIHCKAKLPTMHQDGIQVMGGARLTFRHVTIDCGRAGESLINSNLFIKRAGRSLRPPTDVVCVDCFLGGSAAHTANIQESVRSGLVDSTLCTAKYSKLTLTIGSGAVDPVNVDNSVGNC